MGEKVSLFCFPDDSEVREGLKGERREPYQNNLNGFSLETKNVCVRERHFHASHIIRADGCVPSRDAVSVSERERSWVRTPFYVFLKTLGALTEAQKTLSFTETQWQQNGDGILGTIFRQPHGLAWKLAVSYFEIPVGKDFVGAWMTTRRIFDDTVSNFHCIAKVVIENI